MIYLPAAKKAFAVFMQDTQAVREFLNLGKNTHLLFFNRSFDR